MCGLEVSQTEVNVGIVGIGRLQLWGNYAFFIPYLFFGNVLLSVYIISVLHLMETVAKKFLMLSCCVL